MPEIGPSIRPARNVTCPHCTKHAIICYQDMKTVTIDCTTCKVSTLVTR